MFNIDINAHTPIYKQLIAEIERMIDAGTLREGDCLPSMNELSTELNISKETVKKSIRYFVSEVWWSRCTARDSLLHRGEIAAN